MGLTRQDKEKLVLDLRSQGKTFRQIAKEAQISPLHIKDILNKVEPEEQSMSIPLYDEIKDDDNDIYSLVKFYRLIKSEGMTIQDAVRVLKIANNNDLLSVEHRCQEL